MKTTLLIILAFTVFQVQGGELMDKLDEICEKYPLHQDKVTTYSDEDNNRIGYSVNDGYTEYYYGDRNERLGYSNDTGDGTRTYYDKNNDIVGYAE
jgi:hypothetical protein